LKISKWQTETVDCSRVRQFLNNLLGHPRRPVALQLLVPFLWSQGFAERVHIKSRGIFPSTEELIEKTGRDPWLQHHETSQINSSNLTVERTSMFIGGTRHGLVVRNEMLKLHGIIVGVIVTDFTRNRHNIGVIGITADGLIMMMRFLCRDIIRPKQ
jgi:hypothetical protein